MDKTGRYTGLVPDFEPREIPESTAGSKSDLIGELEERVARVIFIAFMPVNMVPGDWDDGSILGRNNAFRHKIEMAAKLAVVELTR